MFDTQHSRGLAASAVSALALTGLTFVPSQAVAAPSGDVVMISQLDGKASVRPDGDENSTQYVDLVAEQRDPSATISFEFNTNPSAGDASSGWTAVEGRRDTSGRFTTELWDALAYVGTTVSLRAVATTADGVTYSTVPSVTVTGTPEPGGIAPHSVSIFGLAGGYFAQPYASTNRAATQMIVEGTTSAPTGTVDLSWWRSSDGTFQGSTAAALEPGTAKLHTSGDDFTSYDIGEFTAPLDITGYDAESNDGMIAVRGVRDSDTVQWVETYAQTIGSVEALVHDDSRLTALIELTVQGVRYQDNVAGAEVRRLSDQKLIGYTDGHGRVIAEQDAGTTEAYYVNTTDTDAYEPGTDVIAEDVVLPPFEPADRGFQADLADGTYFDDDEYEAGDIALQIVDQEDDPFPVADEEVWYSVYEKGGARPEPTRAETDAAGRVVVPFDPADQDGEHVLEFDRREFSDDDPGQTIEFTSGDSDLTLTPTGGSAASGGQITYTGSLSVDGNPLAGRSIELAYTRGTEAAPGTAADAGIVVGDTRVLTTTATTYDDGAFTVTVADPAEANRPAESGGTLTATATAAKETASASTTFTQGPADPVAPTPPSAQLPVAAKLKLSGSSKGSAADRLKVTSTKAAAGQRVRIFAKVGKKGWKVVKTTRLDRSGRVTVTLKDRNGRKVTSYRVQSTATPTVTSSRSNVKRLR